MVTINNLIKYVFHKSEHILINFADKIYIVIFINFALPFILGYKKSRKVYCYNLKLNNIHILTENYFLKIAYKTPNTLASEHENYCIIKTQFPLICDLIPIQSPFYIWNKFGIKFMKLEKIETESENLEAFKLIFDTFKSYGKLKYCYLKDFKNINIGLIALSDKLDPEQFSNLNSIINVFLKNNQLLIGPVHNDFHPQNILKIREGNPKIIDLDCFDCSGIQSLDQLYYLVEKKNQQNNINWIDYLFGEFLLDEDCKEIDSWPYCKRELVIFFFLNRIGQEIRLFNSKHQLIDLKRVTLLLGV
jgi:hypothetical protein